MITTIFCSVNSTAPGMHWWLANDVRFGPQAYFIGDNTGNDMHIGSLVLEDRDGVHVPVDVYEKHQQTHQNMELLTAQDGYIDFLEPFRSYEDQYEHVVWSNYFGTFQESHWKIKSDRSIIIDSTMQDYIFNYVSVYAFIPLDEEKIERDSRIWYEDHTVLNNQLVNDWKTIWYEKYHNRCLEEFKKGNLKYMWQLNFAHWDLNNALMEGETTFDLDFSESRLFEKFDDYEEIEFNQQVIETNREHSLIVPTDWHNNAKEILDYIGVSDSLLLDDGLAEYKAKYEANRTKFEKLFGKYL